MVTGPCAVRGPAPLNDLPEATRPARSLTSVQLLFLGEKVDLTSQKPRNAWTVCTRLQSFCTYEVFHFIWTKSAVNQVMVPLWSSQCNSSYLSNWSVTQPKKDAINGDAICYRVDSFVEMLWNRQKFLIFHSERLREVRVDRRRRGFVRVIKRKYGGGQKQRETPTGSSLHVRCNHEESIRR